MKPPAPLPISTLTLLLNRFATRASRSPSPFTSPSATEAGLAPAPTGVAAVKPPAPSPRSTLTLSLLGVRDQGVEVAVAVNVAERDGNGGDAGADRRGSGEAARAVADAAR